MRLTYRGVEYDHNPPSLEMSESEILGHYRGRSYSVPYVRHIPVPQPVSDLTYRGVSYRTNSKGQVEVVPGQVKEGKATFHMPARPASSMVEARRQLLREAAKAHRDNIQRTLEHRLAVARAQGNELLVRQLEDEMHQLAV